MLIIRFIQLVTIVTREAVYGFGGNHLVIMVMLVLVHPPLSLVGISKWKVLSEEPFHKGRSQVHKLMELTHDFQSGFIMLPTGNILRNNGCETVGKIIVN